MERRNVYLDHNATTPLHPRVRDEIVSCLELFGNPASIHAEGRAAEEKVTAARRSVAGILGARDGEIVFTSGGSESNATVFSTFAHAAGQIAVLSIEHPSVLEPARALKAAGTPVRFLRVDGAGRLELSDLEEALRVPTALVSVMAANNEIGTVQDIGEAARMAHGAGALFHTDAVQAAGKIPLDVEGLGVDYLALSAHKIHGPKGVGALFVREGAPLAPLIRGGHQEEGRRAGTLNAPGISAFGVACRCAREEMGETAARLAALKEVLWTGILRAAPDAVRGGERAACLPGTLQVALPGVEGEALVLLLDLEGIRASTGSACASGLDEPSATLAAIGLSRTLARSSVRFSLGRDTRREDIEYVLSRLPAALKRLTGK